MKRDSVHVVLVLEGQWQQLGGALGEHEGRRFVCFFSTGTKLEDVIIERLRPKRHSAHCSPADAAVSSPLTHGPVTHCLNWKPVAPR